MEVKDNIRERRQEKMKWLQHIDQDKQRKYMSSDADDRRQMERRYPAPAPALTYGMDSGKRLEVDEANQEHLKPQVKWPVVHPYRGKWYQLLFGKQLGTRILICGALFAAAWGLFQSQLPWAAKGQYWMREMMSEELRFADLAEWYESMFSGTPSFLPSFSQGKMQEARKVDARLMRSFSPPARGIVTVGFSPQHPGIVLKLTDHSDVRSIDGGVVVFAGNREGKGYTVQIQHTNGFQSVYGGLKAAKWSMHDWVQPGEIIGQADRDASGNQVFYFAMLREMVFLNPVDVMEFD